MEVKMRGKRDIWRYDETLSFIRVLKKTNVIKLLKEKKYRVEEVFKLVEKMFREIGFNRTAKQLLIKYKGLKKNYYEAKRKLIRDGTSLEATCPYYRELDGIFTSKFNMKQEKLNIVETNPVYEETCESYDLCSADCVPLPAGLTTETIENDEDNGLYDDIADPRDGAVPGGSRDSYPINTPPVLSDHQYSGPVNKANTFSDNDKLLNGSPRSVLTGKNFSKTVLPTKRTHQLASSRQRTRQQMLFTEQKDMYRELVREIIKSHEKMVDRTIMEHRRLEERAWEVQRDIITEQTNKLLEGLQSIIYPPSFTPEHESHTLESQLSPDIEKQSVSHVYPSATLSPTSYSLSPPPETDMPKSHLQRSTNTGSVSKVLSFHRVVGLKNDDETQ